MAPNLEDPLSGLLGFADIVSDEDGLTGENARFLDHIIASAQRMNAFGDDGVVVVARARLPCAERSGRVLALD